MRLGQQTLFMLQARCCPSAAPPRPWQSCALGVSAEAVLDLRGWHGVRAHPSGSEEDG